MTVTLCHSQGATLCVSFTQHEEAELLPMSGWKSQLQCLRQDIGKTLEVTGKVICLVYLWPGDV